MTSPLEKRIGYAFRDSGLLSLALTHPSASAANNQRLEFLGDAVLGAVVARMLYELFPQEQEGELARRRAALVSGPTLADVARDIGLGEALRVGLSETQSGGTDNSSNLEDALEALIGAMALDGGTAAAERFIVPRWSELACRVSVPPKDAKTALQEWTQARGMGVPHYRLVDSTGPAHAPMFIMEAGIGAHTPVQAQAASKRAAEQAAASMLLAQLQKEGA